MHVHHTCHVSQWTDDHPWCAQFQLSQGDEYPICCYLTIIHDNCQRLIAEQVIHNNACHHSYDYQPGQEVLKLVYKPDKLKICAQGLYDIIVVHSNGTLTIQLNAHTTEHISI
jgi:hypothetical protein